MKVSTLFAAAAVCSFVLAGPALAQGTTAPAKSDTAAPAASTGKKASKPRSAASLECSKEADAKGVHGKDRKKFMSQCKKEAKAGGEKTK